MVHQSRVDGLQQGRGGALDDLDPVQVELDARRNSIQHSQLVSMGLNGKSDYWFCERGKGRKGRAREWPGEGREKDRAREVADKPTDHVDHASLTKSRCKGH